VRRGHVSPVGSDRVAEPSAGQRDPFGARRPIDPAGVATRLLARPDGAPDAHGMVLHLRDPNSGEPLW